MASRSARHRAKEKEKLALICKSGRAKEIAEQDGLAARRQLIAGLLAQLAQSHNLERTSIAQFIYLTCRHFPDRLAYRNSFLPNQDEFSFRRHGGNDDG